MSLLADTLANQRKYAEAERAFRHLLEVQLRGTGAESVNTLVTQSNIGWVQLQLRRFQESEKTLRDARATLIRTAPGSWERFNVDSMLGASLAGQKRFEEAESLLLSGYNGMASAPRSTNQNNTSRFSRDQAGEAIVQMYADWGRPEKQNEWREKTGAR